MKMTSTNKRQTTKRGIRRRAKQDVHKQEVEERGEMQVVIIVVVVVVVVVMIIVTINADIRTPVTANITARIHAQLQPFWYPLMFISCGTERRSSD